MILLLWVCSCHTFRRSIIGKHSARWLHFFHLKAGKVYSFWKTKHDSSNPGNGARIWQVMEPHWSISLQATLWVIKYCKLLIGFSSLSLTTWLNLLDRSKHYSLFMRSMSDKERFWPHWHLDPSWGLPRQQDGRDGCAGENVIKLFPSQFTNWSISWGF